MDIRRLTPELSISPQISATDPGIAAAQGFCSIICNRPDSEGDDRPTAAAVQAAGYDLAGLHQRNVAPIEKKRFQTETLPTPSGPCHRRWPSAPLPNLESTR